MLDELSGEPRRVWSANGTLELPRRRVPSGLVMDQPGGAVERPRRRIFSSTFWPVSRWITTADEDPGPRVAVEQVRAVAVSEEGDIEVVVARNAAKERAWEFLPIPACPARGRQPESTSAAASGREPGATPSDAASRPLRSWSTMRAHAWPTRSHGFVVRTVDRNAVGPFRCRIRTVAPMASACLCDARERDLGALAVAPQRRGSELLVELDGPIGSVRLVPAPSAA